MYQHYETAELEMAEAVTRCLEHAEKSPAREIWDRLVQVGLPLMAVPEADGGLEADARTFHAVAEALGRRSQTTPFATSALASTRLIDRHASEPLRASLFDALASGRSVISLALTEPDASYDIDAIRTTAVPNGDGWTVTGRKVVALNGDGCGHWIVSARSLEGETLLLLLEEGDPGLSVRRYPTLDGGQACDLDMREVHLSSNRQLGVAGAQSSAALREAVDVVELALCAESVGIQAKLLDDTVRYAKERHQFGSAIGSFQVVQHRLVDMLVALEQARTLAWLLATEFETAAPQRRSYLVSAAKVRCIVSGRYIGLQSIHLHGGMGMTDELPVGRGVKRLLAIEHSFGDERHHLARLASNLAVPTSSNRSH